MNPDTAYEKLVQWSKEVAYLRSVNGLLHWDQRTVIPPKGHPHRTEQIALLVRIIHNRMTDPQINDLIAAAEASGHVKNRESIEAVNIREWRRSYDRIAKIPEDLAVALSRASSEGQAAWERARPENDWTTFRPHLEKLVALKQEQADALGYETERYDALLDDYERGETAAGLEPVFSRLAGELPSRVERIRTGTQLPVKKPFTFPIPAQKAFAETVVKQIGLDMDAGRLDISAHPFTSGIGPGDVRITTRYAEHDFSGSFFATIHETGHAMYHQGLPYEHWGTPFGRPISLGIHESQSRMWENMVARSRSFWQHFFPQLTNACPDFEGISMSDFLTAVNRVRPSLIRVEADEVTYNLHIIIRFELETALMRDDLTVADLPEAWKDKMENRLGIRPPDYRSGVMQDVHWAAGAIGYFPTYTLGNLYAAHLFAQAEQRIPELSDLIARGDFVPLLSFLRKEIHTEGSRHLPRDLLRKVTGEDLNPDVFIDYIDRKYAELLNI